MLDSVKENIADPTLKAIFKYNGHSSLLAINPLRVNPTKWSNTLKPFVGNLATNGLSVFDHFAGLALTGLTLKTCKRTYSN